MRLGRARRRVQILYQIEGVRDALNHVSPGAWVSVVDTRGSLTYQYKPVERRDARASTVVRTATAWVTVRYRPGVTSAMRVRVDERNWNIIDVQPDEKQRWMRLLCEDIDIDLGLEQVLLSNLPFVTIERLQEMLDRSALVDARYVHEQMTPADEWLVTHNLGKQPSATVVDSAGQVVVASVEYIDENSLRLVFAAPFAGSAFLN